MIPLTVLCVASLHLASACVDFQPIHGNKINNRFAIAINGEPEFFIPKSVYTVTLHTTTDDLFTSFNLTSRSKKVESNQLSDNPKEAGWFFLKADDEYTTLSSDCMNTITENDPITKDKIQVLWTAPQTGCVVFSANVAFKTKDSENEIERVEKEFCILGERTVLPVPVKKDECCACDDASYKVTVQGLWSNATHPKDFPTTLWLVHFSDFLAATHNRNLKFWREGQKATEGLRQLAEFGSTSILETELREQKKHLRSVAKINGIWHPKVNSNTTTIKLRTDRNHNLFTIASMLGPSPDWFVGVSELNLCEESCSWVENKVIDLYLYDAGTDSGISYMSANEPTLPQDKVYRIKVDYPEDPRAPFYDPSGTPIKPFAKLYLSRDKIIKKSCELNNDIKQQRIDETLASDIGEFDIRDECRVSSYGEWNECSATCGNGVRYKIRNYTDPQAAKSVNCSRRLIIKEACQANQTCPEDSSEEDLELPDEYCKTTSWSEWSECTVTCGIGFMTRTRRFLNSLGNKRCRHIDLLEKKKCMEPPCKQMDTTESNSFSCRKTDWSEWSPCIASCGSGSRVRVRQILDNGDKQEYCSKNTKLIETRECFSTTNCRTNEKNMKDVCEVPLDVGPCRGNYKRWYYDQEKKECLPFKYGGCRGNKNNFLNLNECVKLCYNTPLLS